MNSYTYSDIKQTIDSAVTVTVALNDEFVGTYTLSGVKVNNKTLSKEYVTRFENAVVKIAGQDDLGGTTKFTFSVKADDDYEVSDLIVTAENNLS
ncbi:hypothetical protein J6V86_03240 [bacterium]|nr:hypothetical protein [bacterium]